MRKYSAIALLLILFISSCRKDADVGEKDFKTLGTSSRDFLASNAYTSLKVEISYMPGYEPADLVLSQFKSFLETYLNKPSGVTVTKKQISSTEKPTLAIKDIVSLEKSVRSAYTIGSVLSAHILVVDSDYEQEKILGTSYWNTSFCLFGKTFYGYSGGQGQISRNNLYLALLEHEMGHLLGLVDQGSPMQTPHKANGAHCDNDKCLMNYQLETGSSSGVIALLDTNCHNDLKANGGK